MRSYVPLGYDAAKFLRKPHRRRMPLTTDLDAGAMSGWKSAFVLADVRLNKFLGSQPGLFGAVSPKAVGFGRSGAKVGILPVDP